MSAKEYLKMSDAFVHNDVASLEQHIYAGYMSMHACEYAAHAIDSHDELVAENERLRTALECATNHFPGAAKMVPDGCAVLMTLDEAIDHANEKSIGSSQCAAQHAQLAKWLTDYRAMLAAAPKPEDS